MKKIMLFVLISLSIPASAYAEEPGAWVIVDSNGVAVSQAIVCTPSVCGNPDSAVSKDLLKPGQKFVLQTHADANGNVAGIGAGQRGNSEVKVNEETKEWTVTTKNAVPVQPIQVTETSDPIETVEPKPTKVKLIAETTVIERINIDATTTVISQNAVIDTTIIETPPVSSSSPEVIESWYDEWVKEWQELFKALELLFQGWVLIW